jgi:hypothetical protein
MVGESDGTPAARHALWVTTRSACRFGGFSLQNCRSLFFVISKIFTNFVAD